MGMKANQFRKVRYPDSDDDYRRASRIKQQKKKIGRDLCGKARYDDEFEAGKHLKRAQAWAQRNGFKMPVRYYYHKKCGGYHLTSQTEKGVAA